MPRTPTALLFVAALSIVAAVPPAIAQGEDPTAATAEPAPAPRVVVDEPIADLGSTDRGQTVTHDFVLRNEGQAPLQILEVRPACGCTVAEYDQVIPPGGTGRIHAALDTATFEGPVSKGINVLTNDPANPRLRLTMKLRVEEDLTFSPAFARFSQGHGHPPAEVSALLFSPNFPGLEVEKAGAPYPFMAVAVREAGPEERREEVAGNQWVVTVTLDYDQAPVGPVAGQVEVQTNHPRHPLGRLPVSGFVRPLLKVTPSVADFGEIDSSARPTARFVVHNFGADPVQVTGAEPDLPGAKISVEPLEEGRRYKVELVLGRGMPQGPFVGELRIRTDSPEEPLVVVPVKGTIL